MKVLFLGDIVGEIGVRAVCNALPHFKRDMGSLFVIANGENAAPNGKGIGWRQYKALKEAGVDCLTLGNHYEGRQELSDFIADADIVRPLNVLGYHRGSGSSVFEFEGFNVRVTNVLGTAFMREEVASPYDSVNELFKESKEAIHIIDYHAESSSEKQIFGYVFDGRVSAVFGTHTHVQTADERILPQGTGFITDAGYCGAYEAIIGYDPEVSIKKILFGEKTPFRVPESGETIITGVLLEIEPLSGKTLSIERISIKGEVNDGADGL